MIGLHQQGVTARQLRFDMLAGVSQVGQNAQVHCAIGASQLQRFAGIVRYGEGVFASSPGRWAPGREQCAAAR